MGTKISNPTPPVFIKSDPNFKINKIVMGEYIWLWIFWQILWHFEIFVNTGPYGLEISKRYSYSFIQTVPNFMINKAVVRECNFMVISAICQKLKLLWHFEILTWESMGNLKCAIS